MRDLVQRPLPFKGRGRSFKRSEALVLKQEKQPYLQVYLPVS